MTTIVNIHEAKTHLSKLLERVRKGEQIVIAQSQLENLPLISTDPEIAQ